MGSQLVQIKNATMTATKISRELIEFLELLRNSVTDDHQAFVERWSDVECFHELVVRAIYNRLSFHDVYGSEYTVSDVGARSAIAEIVNSSPLGQLVSFDDAGGSLLFRETITDDVKEQVSRTLLKGTRVMPTPSWSKKNNEGKSGK